MISAAEPRPKYNSKILAERNKNDARYFRIHEIFNPRLKGKVLTGKFYSPHDITDISIADPELVERIRLNQEGVPKEKYAVPLTINQSYGWYASNLLVPLRKGDTRFYAPAIGTISKIPQARKRK